MILDGTKIAWHMDRVRAWERGEHISPITIDMALTTRCNMSCQYCYAKLQTNEQHTIKKDHITSFLNDCAILGVRGISLVSDGESSIHPDYEYFITYCKSLGIDIASGTNGYLLNKVDLYSVLKCLTYLRINISAGEEDRYQEIMGAKAGMFFRVISNIQQCLKIKEEYNLPVTIGMQMVFLPKYQDQLIPLSKLAIDLGVDYLVIKHCSDDEFHTLGVNYDDYKRSVATLREVEGMSTERTKIVIKWSKINNPERCYSRCYSAPFLMQVSGTGLVAPCGMLYNDRYSHYHMGNITTDRFIDIIRGERYWTIVNELKSSAFDAKKMCGSLCLAHKINEALDGHIEGGVRQRLVERKDYLPEHINFI